MIQKNSGPSFIRSIRFSVIVLPLLAFMPQKTDAVAADPSMQFNLTDADIKALGLSDAEAQQFKQFFDELNNMSPAQKKQLEDFGRQIEEKMREEGYDPTDPDQLMKYVEKEGGNLAPNAQKQPLRKPEVKPAQVEPAIEKPIIVAVASPTSTLKMLQDISKHVAAFRQKALTHPSMSIKLDAMHGELSELTNLLPLLKTADLITLLSSKEFMFLHENFESLHKVLATYEPSIIAQKKALFDENDPYEVLGVPYDATKEQIAERFNALKASDAPAAIEAHLKKEQVPVKSIKKQVKRARVSFGFIERAHKILTSPKERAAVDKKLHQKIEKATKRDAASTSAFNHIYAALSGRVRSQLLPAIKQLLERYKPQELAKAREQMALEQRAYERSKQIVKIPQMMPRENFNQGPYEEFYRKMAQESYMRPQLPQQRTNGAMTGTNGMGPKGPEKPEAAAAGGKPGEKDKGKGGGGKGSGGDTDKGKPGKDDGKVPKPADSKKDEPLDFKKLKPLDTLIGLLETADALQDTVDIRSGDTEGEEERPKSLPQIVTSLKAELGGTRGSEKPADSASHLYLYFQTRNLEGITKAMKDVTKLLVPEKGKPVSEQLKKEYIEQIFKPYGSMITHWHNNVFPALTATGNNQELVRKHNLKRDLPVVDAWAKPAKGAKDAPKPKIDTSEVKFTDLGKVRDDLYTLNSYFATINGRLQPGNLPPVAVKPNKKLGE